MIILYSWFFSYVAALIFSINFYDFKSKFYHKAAIRLTAKDDDYYKLMNKSRIYEKYSANSVFVCAFIFCIIYLILSLTIPEVSMKLIDLQIKNSTSNPIIRVIHVLMFIFSIACTIVINIYGFVLSISEDGWLRKAIMNLFSNVNTIKMRTKFDDFVINKIIAKEKQLNKKQINSIN